MSQELDPDLRPIRPFRPVFLEGGETVLVFCTICYRVIYKGRDDNRISSRVMNNQIESHQMAFGRPHSVEIIQVPK